MFVFSRINFRKFIGVVLFLQVFFSFLPLSMEVSTGEITPIAHPITITASALYLNFSSFLGGSGWDGDYGGCGFAVASDGSCYVTGKTNSSNFPTLNAYDNTFNGFHDAFVAKFSSNGSLLWSTFLGGSGYEYGKGIAIDSNGNCYVIGSTGSSDFPTLNAYDSTFNGGDAFVTKFNASGSLLWSTYLGGTGNEYGDDIVIASDGSCYVTGITASENFPILNAYDSTYNAGSYDAFVTKLSASGSLLWSTYLGGSGWDHGFSIAVANDGSCYVTGETDSSDFPTLNAYDSTFNGFYDAFVTKFSISGSLLWSTFLGGSDAEHGEGIGVASDGSCYVTGITLSNDFPILNAYDSTNSFDAFVTKFSTSGSLLWSTFLGGVGDEVGFDIAVLSNGHCYVTGRTYSSDFPTLNAYDSTHNAGFYSDVFVTKFSTNGSLLWSTYLGGSDNDYGYGIAVTSSGSCYVTGDTYSSNFPTKNAYNSTYGGIGDFFVTKFTEDITSPLITNINHAPENPTTKDTITINCTATDENGVQFVTLYYRINNGSWVTVAMTSSAPDTYQALLALKWNVNDLVEYYIKATDNSPNHNEAVEDNESLYYEITISNPQGISAYGVLAFIVVMPIISLVLRKRRK